MQEGGIEVALPSVLLRYVHRVRVRQYVGTPVTSGRHPAELADGDGVHAGLVRNGTRSGDLNTGHAALRNGCTDGDRVSADPDESEEA